MFSNTRNENDCEPPATYSARIPTRMNADPKSRYSVSFIAAYSFVPTPVRPIAQPKMPCGRRCPDDHQRVELLTSFLDGPRREHAREDDDGCEQRHQRADAVDGHQVRNTQRR